MKCCIVTKLVFTLATSQQGAWITREVIMANTPATIDRGKEAWETYVTQRTKANPKNSLFGTTLEHVDKGAVSTINAAEYETNALTQRHVKASQYDHKLPSRLQNKAAKDQLQVAKEQIGKKEQELNNRQAALSDMEKRAKYYASVAPSLHKDEQLKKKLLLAEPGLDFELVNKMNNVGYAKINTYNKDKHRERPPAHKYAVIGDPLEYGMDFSLHQTETHEKYKGHIPISEQLRHHRSLRQYKSAPPTVLEKGAIPANIRAKYRSYLVDELFADQEAVDKVKHQLNEEKIRQQRRHEKTELPPVVLTTPKNYGDLSHALRQDKFGGYSFLNASLMKDSHTQQVFDRRYRDPDEFRHTWDEYGKWAAMNLQREQQKN
ncbi:hypothetical protein EB796_001726 [Bugula neritina]|uniref:TEX33 n=1 Tax=Bugula neritina TaxID=10212 RepID=A0A7J7KP61_BUGNE|nr:hypothetical protein EB796_001726 [Bugula neritina]